MDPEEALFLLETELIDPTAIEYNQLAGLVDALKVAAKTGKGYSGFAWETGTKLLEAFSYHGISPEIAFNEFGWDTLANGIHQAILDRQLLQGLSYVNSQFLASNKSTAVFNQSKIALAVRDAFSTVPQAFIKPSVLGSVDPAIQEEFGRLLEALPNLSDDTELTLQWSASILRVVPIHTEPYRIAAITLLNVLHREKQIFSTYYAFRALAEQHENLWSSPICGEIIQTLIQGCQVAEQEGEDILEQLISDDNVIRIMNSNINLLFLIGSLAIHLTKKNNGSKIEATAWRFVNELHTHSSLVAHEFEKYLVNNELPTLPTSNRSHIEEIEQRFHEVCAGIESELRPRNYKRLAHHIYQNNIEEVLQPLYEQVCTGACTLALIEEIRQIDPEELVKKSELQQASAYQTGTKVERKMIADFAKVLNGLSTAAELKIKLDAAQRELEEDKGNKLSVFWDFDALLKELAAPAKWALQTLLPLLWNALNHGVDFVTREAEGRRYGAR